METHTFKLNSLVYAGITMRQAIDRCRHRAYEDNRKTDLFVKVDGGWILLGTYQPDPSSPAFWYGTNHQVKEVIPFCVSMPVLPGEIDEDEEIE